MYICINNNWKDGWKSESIANGACNVHDTFFHLNELCEVAGHRTFPSQKNYLPRISTMQYLVSN